MFKEVSFRSVLASLVAGLLVIAPALGGQDDKPIKIGTDLVTIDVTVTDKDGNFIRNLKAEDFVIYEDGQPQKLDFFEASEEAALTRPVAVVFALDASGSIKPEEVIRQREATEIFIKMLRPESVYSLVAFNHEIRVLQDFTNDARKLSQAFQKIGEAAGSTRLFGGIERSIALLKRAPKFRNGRRLRRVVVVITDGIGSDTMDQPGMIPRPGGPLDMIQVAQDAGVTVYSITLPSYAPGLGGKRSITLLDASRLVPATGGADYSADSKDFTPAFKAIAEEIKSSYTLAYYPPDKSRGNKAVRQIKVEVKRSGAIPRASRTSYQSGE